jgi:hypothetical protein
LFVKDLIKLNIRDAFPVQVARAFGQKSRILVYYTYRATQISKDLIKNRILFGREMCRMSYNYTKELGVPLAKLGSASFRARPGASVPHCHDGPSGRGQAALRSSAPLQSA